jgi:hypothetical protein
MSEMICKICNSAVHSDPLFHLCPRNYDEMMAVLDIFNNAPGDTCKSVIRRMCQQRIEEMRAG